jgi:hypothetical protein
MARSLAFVIPAKARGSQRKGISEIEPVLKIVRSDSACGLVEAGSRIHWTSALAA